jgi:hypothetical protein
MGRPLLVGEAIVFGPYRTTPASSVGDIDCRFGRTKQLAGCRLARDQFRYSQANALREFFCRWPGAPRAPIHGVARDRNTGARISLRMDAVHAAGLENSVEADGALSAGVEATKMVIFATRNRGFRGVLGSIIRHLEPAVGDLSGQRLPSRQGIPNCRREAALPAYPFERGFKERLKLLERRPGVFGPRRPCWSRSCHEPY